MAEPPQLEDTWVTVYGFGRPNQRAVLAEFQKCGEICEWGTLGASDDANFMHIQYVNKYAAARALSRNGVEIAPNLIVGVKTIDPRHRQLAEAHAGAAAAAPTLVVAPPPAPRPFQPAAPPPPQGPVRAFVAKLADVLLGL